MKDNLENKVKPIKAKPRLYAVYFTHLMDIAKEMGYNLLISGSMDRDMDLIAVPWIETPAEHIDLLRAFSKYLGAGIYDDIEHYHFSLLPGGRSSYIINLCRIDVKTHTDPQYYIDISITPLVKI